MFQMGSRMGCCANALMTQPTVTVQLGYVRQSLEVFAMRSPTETLQAGT